MKSKKIYPKNKKILPKKIQADQDDLSEQDRIALLEEQENMLKENEDTIFHCTLYKISWDAKEKLVSDCFACMGESLELCAKANNWTLHRACIDSYGIAFVVQADPFVSLEKVLHTFRDFLATRLKKAHPEMKVKDLFGKDTVLETMSPSDLKSNVAEITH